MMRLTLFFSVICAFAGPARSTSCQVQADLVLGQPDFTSWGANQTPGCIDPGCQGKPAANTISLDDARFAFDAEGRVWVSDKENDRVLRFDPPFASGMDAALVIGQPDFTTNSHSPESRRIDAASLYGPQGLAFDVGLDGVRGSADARLWVVDRHNNRILRFDPPFSTGMSASVVLGQPDFTTSGENYSGLIGRLEPVANGFDNPADIAIDSLDNLWIADTNNNRVLVYFAPVVEPGVSPSADAVLGQPDFRSRQPNRGADNAVRNGFYAPRAIAVDGQDQVWIVDNDNNRIVRYDAPDNSANLVIGQPDFTSSQSYRGHDAPTRDGLRQPTGIAIDSRSSVWVTDPGGRRVVRYDAPVSVNDGADVVLGQPDFTTAAAETPAATANTFGRPNGIGVDREGNMWVADHDFDRILRFRCADGA